MEIWGFGLAADTDRANAFGDFMIIYVGGERKTVVGRFGGGDINPLGV